MKFQQILKAGSATAVIGAALASQTAYAQDATDTSAEDAGNPIVVTGSRIVRPNEQSSSPIVVATGEDTIKNADITLDTYLNTLPAVNPAASTTSNNPGNGGQSTVDLRGLGSNRNLVLIDGRRPMVSSSSQDVDLNTIPQGLIERIEVVTGGAGAAYGADAIAGVVNIKMKDDFEGVDLRYNYANTGDMDAEEWAVAGTIGGNFADDRGNFAVSAEHSEREALTKGQRPFAAQATSTTLTFPTGRFVESGGNPITQAAINSVFATYGVSAAQSPIQGLSKVGFNSDKTLFNVGVFNNPNDVSNFRDAPGVNPNLNYFPDFYTYNFDIINYLVLPLKRDSVFGVAHYTVSNALEFFAQGSWTNYSSATALAPTPVGTGVQNPATRTSVRNATSALVEPGRRVAAFVIPVTNPFIPNDLRTLLNSRTGNDVSLVGSGATEPFRVSKRFLDTGLRQTNNDNTVIQGLLGVRGEFAPGWRYEAYASKGKTTIDTSLDGNVNVDDVQRLLEAADGGNSICAGGFNPFGVQPLSAACLAYVSEPATTKTTFTQEIFQGYITGTVAELPAGALQVVAGAEHRSFDYFYDAGTLNGPIAGFNTGTDDNGSNTFTDYFGEVSIPLIKDGFVQGAEISFQARHSTADFNDIINGVDGKPQGSWAYGANLSVDVNDALTLRGSYQHSVRAPNFGELFSGGSSFPQYYDPCTKGSGFVTGGAGNQALCVATGAPVGFAQTPGGQAFIGVTGNTALGPEEGDTFTGGLVFNVAGLRGSIDYYNIKLSKAIFGPDPNIIIAACYNYYGTNTSLSAASPYCSGLRRVPDISYISLPASLGGDSSGYFQSINQGSIKTSGIDFQLGYNLPTEFIGPDSSIQFNLLANYLIDWKKEELPGITIDYAGTAAYFGAGLGQSFPRFKANLQTRVNFDENLSLDTRFRYTSAMKNRAAVQFLGEQFTGPRATVYIDTALQAKVMDKFTFRLGVNNLLDKAPQQYAPNVQSGTDPSLYDVIGRRFYVQVGLKL